MLIEVTQDDIDNGRRGQACSCPLARAIKRQTNAEYIRVGLGSISIGEDVSDCSCYITPDIAVNFVMDFDSIHDVAPFSFQLNTPFVEEQW